MGNSFFDILIVHPIINILVVIYTVLTYIHVPYAFGFSIILLTVFIRVLLYPLTSSQLRASKKMQEISPHIQRLKDKHKGDAKTLQAETMKLYKEFGVNPAAGCVPLLVQLPILWALYPLLSHLVTLPPQEALAQINKIVYIASFKLSIPWDQYFFAIPLGKNPSQLLSIMPFILLVPILTGALQFIQAKMMMSVKPKEATQKPDDFSSAFQTQSLYIFPFMIGFFSYQFPIGLSLYWNTLTLFGILQQYHITGLGGLEAWFKKQPKIKYGRK